LLSTYVNSDGTNCFPSMKRLAENTALTDRTVKSALETAETEGWIIRETQVPMNRAGFIGDRLV
jgi:DNA-binding transcriptional regulator YhcF (GntR family)